MISRSHVQWVITAQKGVLHQSNVHQGPTRMNLKQMHVKRVLLGITVTIKIILVTLQAICVPMGFIVPMEQGMQLSLVVQMEHMEMEHSYSILISVSSVHLENSAMVRVAKKTVIKYGCLRRLSFQFLKKICMCFGCTTLLCDWF